MSRAGYSFIFAKRRILGMMFVAAAMVEAGVVEHFRLQSLKPDYKKSCFNSYVPEKIALQFTVMVAPSSMKVVITGLFYFFSGISSFVGIAVLSMITTCNIRFLTENFGNLNCWYPCSPETKCHVNECHFDHYFFFSAGYEVFGVILFIIVAWVNKLNVDELTFHSGTKSELEGREDRHVQKGLIRS